MDNVLDGAIVLAIAALWSFIMARYVAPYYVMSQLDKHLTNINDPNDRIATSIRKTAGYAFSLATTHVATHPETMKPVVDAFWSNIKMKALGQRGGLASGGGGGFSLPAIGNGSGLSLGSFGQEEMGLVSAAMEAGPDAVSGILQMFGLPRKASDAAGKALTSYVAAKLQQGAAGQVFNTGGEEVMKW